MNRKMAEWEEHGEITASFTVSAVFERLCCGWTEEGYVSIYFNISPLNHLHSARY